MTAVPEVDEESSGSDQKLWDIWQTVSPWRRRGPRRRRHEGLAGLALKQAERGLSMRTHSARKDGKRSEADKELRSDLGVAAGLSSFAAPPSGREGKVDEAVALT